MGAGGSKEEGVRKYGGLGRNGMMGTVGNCFCCNGEGEQTTFLLCYDLENVRTSGRTARCRI